MKVVNGAWVTTLLGVLGTSAWAQPSCEPSFEHRTTPGGWQNVALVDLEPGGWLRMVAVAPGRGLEIWAFALGRPAMLDRVIEADLDDLLVSADFDADGDTDVLVRDRSLGVVRIFENRDGDLVGGRGTPMTEEVVIAPSDFDGDGLPDLAVATESSVSLYLNRSDGTFIGGASIEVSGFKKLVREADVNGDRFTDVLVHRRTSQGWVVTPVVQDPDGGLLVLSDFRVYFVSPIFGDFDGDGLTDLAYLPNGLAFGVGDGTFRRGMGFDPDVYHSLVAAADLDGDGHTDLIANADQSGTGYGTQCALLNDGSGAFTLLDYPLGSALIAAPVVTADVDGDGVLDIVGGRISGLDLRLGSGDGRFEQVPFLPLYEDLCRRVALGDLDNDGDPDAVTSGDGPEPLLTILENDGSGSLSVSQHITVPGAVFERTNLADFDGDGDLDILAWMPDHGLWLFEQRDDGFGSVVHVLPNSRGGPAHVAFTGDFNVDGRIDIVASDADDETRGYSIYLNEGAWAFSREFVEQPEADQVVALADMDGDGVPDLLCAPHDTPRGQFFLCAGTGLGGFGRPSPTGAASQRVPFATPGDFNGDGATDFFAYAWRGSRQNVYLSRGDGTFDASAELVGFDSPRDPGVTDLDGDGRDELVVAAQNGGEAVVHSFDGEDAISRRVRFGMGTSVMLGTVLADMNGDGALDIVMPTNAGYSAGSQRLGGVAVFLNQCPGCPPDFNGDGVVDTRDVIAFLGAWSAGDGAADFNDDGVIDARDVLAFLGAWADGC